MTTRTHARILTFAGTVAVLSTSLAPLLASTTLPLYQQDSPPLVQTQTIMQNANKFLKSTNKNRGAKRLDDAQAKAYTMLASGGSVMLSGVWWLTQCAGYCSPEINVVCLLAPPLVSLISYLGLQQCTTSSYYENAASKATAVIKDLQNDDFFNGSINDYELEGYVMVRFGTAQGAINAIENYRMLYNKIQNIDAMLEEVVGTQDENLAQQCAELQKLITDLATQLIKKIAILSERLKSNIKEQLQQKFEDEKKVRKAVEKERDMLKQEQQRLAQELAQERDRAAAIQNGTISYQRTVGNQ